MVWLELLLAGVAGIALGGLLLLGRTRMPSTAIAMVWILVAAACAVPVYALATEPLLVLLVGTVVAVVVALVGTPWVAGATDPHVRELPYWSRLRADARLRADERRREARPAHEAPEHRDLSTPED